MQQTKKPTDKKNATVKKYFLQKAVPTPLEHETVFYDETCTEFFENFHHNFEIVIK